MITKIKNFYWQESPQGKNVPIAHINLDGPTPMPMIMANKFAQEVEAIVNKYSQALSDDSSNQP